MPTPTLFMAKAGTRFDPGGALTDLAAVQALQRFVQAFEQWMERMAPTVAVAVVR